MKNKSLWYPQSLDTEEKQTKLTSRRRRLLTQPSLPMDAAFAHLAPAGLQLNCAVLRCARYVPAPQLRYVVQQCV